MYDSKFISVAPKLTHSLTSTGIIQTYSLQRKNDIYALKFQVQASPATAAVITFLSQPVVGSGLSGVTPIGTLTIPAGAAIGKVYTKNVKPFAAVEGSEIVIAVTTASSSGSGMAYTTFSESPEVEGNSANVFIDGVSVATPVDLTYIFYAATLDSVNGSSSPNSFVELSSNRALTVNPLTSGRIIAIQDAAGSKTLTINGLATTLNSGANAITVINYVGNSFTYGYTSVSSPGPNSSITLSSNQTINLTDLVNNKSYGTISATQDSNGSRTLTINGLSASINPVANTTTQINFYYVDGQFFIVSNYAYVPPTALDLNFPTLVNTTKSGTTYTNSDNGGTNWSAYGLSDRKLAAGQDGWFQTTVGDMCLGMIGFKTSKAAGDYTTFDLAVWTAGSAANGSGGPPASLSFIDGNGNLIQGDDNNVIPLNAIYRIGRFSGIFKAQYSTDSGSTWVDKYTYNASATTSGDLFAVMNIRGDGKLLAPKQYGMMAS